jgi:hypothetical protein
MSKWQGTIDYFRLTIDYCISTQRMQRAEGMGQGAGAIDYFRLAIDYCVSPHAKDAESMGHGAIDY